MKDIVLNKKILTFVHPFLFAIFPTIFLFYQNINELTLEALWEPLIAVFIGTATLFILLRILIKDTVKTGIVTSIFVVTLLYYGFVYDITLDWHFGGFKFGRHRYLLPLWGMLFIFSVYFSTKTKKSLLNLAKIISISATTLVLISVFNIGVHKITKSEITLPPNDGNEDIISNNDFSLENPPDIYYIIPDMYVNSNVLNNFFDYDNKDFIDYLDKKGFAVANESLSNYPITHLSLASTLNMEYVNYLGDIVEADSKDFDIVKQMILDNRTLRFLKSKDYKFIYFGPKDLDKYADISFSNWTINEFSSLLVETTILRPFGSRHSILKNIKSNGLRKEILDIFDNLNGVPNIEGSKFVLVHIPSPHWPYLFGPNGEEVAAKFTGYEEMDYEKEFSMYRDQLIFINKKLEVAIDEILSKSKIPPIIIIQSDHGYALPNLRGREQDNVSVKNFSAYYLPGKDKDILPNSMTSVNTFRLVFDQYFSTSLGFLENKSYLYDEERPFEFIEINPIYNREGM